MNSKTWYEDCPNCSAAISMSTTHCPVCCREFATESGETVRFSDTAREAVDGLGGLLQILPTNGCAVHFIGKCVGGLIGINKAGELVWRDDWLYIVTIDVEPFVLRVNGVEIDIDSGSPLAQSQTKCVQNRQEG